MFRILLFLFIVTPLVEFSLLYLLSRYVLNLGGTILLVLITGFVGAWLARREGYRTWQRIQEELGQGKMPSSSLLDALMIFIAGALLVTPGVLTDVFGFSLLIPPCRTFYKALSQRYFAARFKIQSGPLAGGGPGGVGPAGGGQSDVIDSYVVEDRTTDAADEKP